MGFVIKLTVRNGAVNLKGFKYIEIPPDSAHQPISKLFAAPDRIVS